MVRYHYPTGGSVFDSVSTDDALNSEIGDGVDYLDPLWFAQSDAIVVNRQPSTAAEWNSSTSGSGAVNFRFWATEIETGTTADSTAILSDQMPSRGRTDLSMSLFDNVVYGRLPARLDAVSANGILEWGVGDLAGINNSKAVYIRRNSAGDLVGVAHDGSSETTTTLITGYSPESNDDVLIEYTTSEALFIVNGFKEGAISSGLPSGGTKSYIGYRVDNNGDGANNKLQIEELSVVMGR